MSDNISICVVNENKKNFLPLLLLGDESARQIDKYLDQGELFVLYDGDDYSAAKCLCVVTDEGGGTLEIQNLATDEQFQRRGYASQLVEFIADHYIGRYDHPIIEDGVLLMDKVYMERNL